MPKRPARLLSSLPLALGAALLALSTGVATPVAEESSPPPEVVGHTAILFSQPILDALGVEVRGAAPSADPDRQGALGFGIRGPAQLLYEGAHVNSEGFSSGALSHVGGFTLAFDAVRLRIHDFELRVAEGPYAFELYDSQGNRWFRLGSLQYDYSPDRTQLRLVNADVLMSPEFAKLLGRSDLENSYVAVMDVVLPAELPQQVAAPGNFALQGAVGSCDPPNPALDIDVALVGLSNPTQLGREAGGRVAMAPSADLQNVGTGTVEWFETLPPDDVPEQLGPHPYLSLHFYRLADGRLQMLGQSDLKHAFLSINTGCPCEPGHLLYPGCSDSYGNNLNGRHENLGPRDEVSAHTGDWNRVGSHFDSFDLMLGDINPMLTDDFRSHGGSIDHPDLFEHRLVVQEPDLQTAGGQYFIEAWYVVADDIDIMNSMGHRRVTPSLIGETWSFTTTTNLQNGSILDEFVNPTSPPAGATSELVDTGEGRFQLAVRTSSLNNGDFHWEFALMNFDFDRQIRSFSVPLPPGVTVSNLSFNDVDGAGPNDWTTSVIPGSSVTFTAPAGNSLDWGTLYNFAFDSNAPGSPGNVTLTPLEAGAALAPVASLTPDPAGIIPGGDSNDDCADRRVIGTGTTFGTLFGASRDGESSEDVGGSTRDVWFEFTPSRTGEVRINTCRTSDIPTQDLGVDTIVSVHTACTGSPGNELLANDDFSTTGANAPTDPEACRQLDGSGVPLDSGLELDSALSLNLTQGVPVVVRVTQADAVGDDFLLTILEPPANDDFTNPTAIGGGTTAGTLDQAAEDFPQAPIPSQPDVWYRFDPSQTGDIRLDTCGTFEASGVDTILRVFDLNSGGDPLAANDDYEFGSDPTACSGPTASFLDSAVALRLTNLDPLLIQVSRFDESASGDFSLSLDPNPPFQVTMSAFPTVVGVGGTSSLAWYGFQASTCTATGAWSGARPISGFEDVMPAVDSDYRITCSPLAGGGNQFAEVSVAVASLANDTCSAPVMLTSSTLPFSQAVDVSIASADVSDPDTLACTGAMMPDGATVWYSFTPKASELVQVSTLGSDYDTVVSVWDAAPGCGNLVTQIACNDQAQGTSQSQLVFSAQLGTSYLIQVGDWNGGPGGRLVLNVPEPGASALGAAALGVLAALHSRRRSRAGARATET